VFDANEEMAEQLAITLGCPAWGGRPEQLSQARNCDLVIVATPDAVIETVASLAVSWDACAQRQVWLHLAGARDETALEALRPRVRGIVACHPACAFPSGCISPIPQDTCFGLTGNETGLRVARDMVLALHGIPLEVPAEKRTGYHAAAVMASNLVVALLSVAQNVLTGIGVEDKSAEKFSVSLGRSALERAARLGLRDGLTGPLSRGDALTIERHLDALDDDRAQTLYLELSKAALALAQKRTGPGNPGLEAVSRVLKNKK
jgi:predicted short-subunit dehydrogenase-like oxidoreductase (DUF2520 family)